MPGRTTYLGHMTNLDGDLITTRQAADLIGESVRQTTRRIDAGTLTPAHKLDGLRGAYLFRRTDVETFIQQRDEAAKATA
ncbi:DNA-binding protein [Clavibacter michiganensis subsp. michiganensis]|nr:DNA-binding protein [Clavibacter michiganensis subsp. michiganensis]